MISILKSEISPQVKSKSDEGNSVQETSNFGLKKEKFLFYKAVIYISPLPHEKNREKSYI